MRTEESLVADVAAGDVDALGRLYDRLAPQAFGVALRVLRNRSLAEEAVHDAFLSAWRSPARVDAGRGSARTWILTLVHRRAVDAVRAGSRRAPAAEMVAPAAAEPTVDAGDVRDALRALPPSERASLVLAYYGDLEQRELAGLVDAPLGTIKSRTHAGLARLRTLLAEPAEART